MNKFILKNKTALIVGIVIFVVALLFFSIAFPYMKAEYLTMKYGKQFNELYSLNGWIDEIEFFKVIDYSENEAKVYYVEKDRLTTNYFYFYRENELSEWKLKTWHVIYAQYGSADDIAWPYYFQEWFI